MVVHPDRLGRLDDRQPLRIEPDRADEDGLEVSARRSDGAGDDLVRSAIASQGVDGDANHAGRLRRVETERLDVAAAVRLAGRADAVRLLRLLAGGAHLEVRDGDPMLRAALVAPRPRRLSLRDGHERLGTIAAALSSA
jgi:hypothetical protein